MSVLEYFVHDHNSNSINKISTHLSQCLLKSLRRFKHIDDFTKLGFHREVLNTRSDNPF